MSHFFAKVENFKIFGRVETTTLNFKQVASDLVANSITTNSFCT